MVTRAQHGIFKPNPKYANVATIPPSISPIPKSVRTALRDQSWLTAMQDEYRALMSNRTWELVPRPPGANIVIGKWLFRHKFKADNTLDRYKARWVVRGFTQRPGVDFSETFNPVVCPQRCALCSPSLPPRIGRCTKWTSTMRSSRGTCASVCSVSSLSASSTLIDQTMSASSTNHSTT
jgi:hypothetical protein